MYIERQIVGQFAILAMSVCPTFPGSLRLWYHKASIARIILLCSPELVECERKVVQVMPHSLGLPSVDAHTKGSG